MGVLELVANVSEQIHEITRPPAEEEDEDEDEGGGGGAGGDNDSGADGDRGSDDRATMVEVVVVEMRTMRTIP